VVAPGASAAARLVWSELFGVAALAAVCAAGANVAPGPFLRLARPRPAVLAVAVLLGAVGFAAAEAIAIPWVAALPPAWLQRFDVGKLFDQPLSGRLAIAAAATLVAPPCEELAFRGYVLSALAARRGPAAGIAGSAVLFGLIHFDPVRFPAVLALGLLYGWMAWRTGSIWPSTIAHMVNNGIVSAGALAMPVGRLADARPGGAAVTAALAIGVLAAAGLLALGALLRRLGPVPGPSGEAVARDPDDAAPGFRWARVSPRLALVVPASLLGLAALVAEGWWRSLHP
jgi:membrane protease YdiL (CAAX protease family)